MILSNYNPERPQENEEVSTYLTNPDPQLCLRGCIFPLNSEAEGLLCLLPAAFSGLVTLGLLG